MEIDQGVRGRCIRRLMRPVVFWGVWRRGGCCDWPQPQDRGRGGGGQRTSAGGWRKDTPERVGKGHL